MEPSIYSFSLYTALPLMLFFGFYFLFAKTPEKKIFKNYLRSRQIMGIAMLLLSANYSVHFFFGIRFKNADSAILMNMSTYFLCYSLFSSALIMLLDRFYITKRRVWTHIILWIIFSTLSGVVLFLLPSGIMQKFSLFALAVWLVVFGVVLARRVIIAYRRAIRIFNETQADDIGTYIEWLSIFTYWAVIFGVGCGLLTFLPDKYVFIWILSSIPFYSYLFYSYQNYLLFYEQVENAFEQDIQSEEELLTDTETEPKINDKIALHALRNNCHYIDIGGYGILRDLLKPYEKSIEAQKLCFIIGVGWMPGISGVFSKTIIETHLNSPENTNFNIYYGAVDNWSYSSTYDLAASSMGKTRSYVYSHGKEIQVSPFRYTHHKFFPFIGHKKICSPLSIAR